MEVSLLENKIMKDRILRCGCGIMIECEVKTGQTGESIEHTRWEGGEFVEMQVSN